MMHLVNKPLQHLDKHSDHYKVRTLKSDGEFHLIPDSVQKSALAAPHSVHNMSVRTCSNPVGTIKDKLRLY